MAAALDEECVQEEEAYLDRGRAEIALGSPDPHNRGTGRTGGLTVEGEPVVLHTSHHILAHHCLHILQGLRSQGVPKAGLLPPGESCR